MQEILNTEDPLGILKPKDSDPLGILKKKDDGGSTSQLKSPSISPLEQELLNIKSQLSQGILTPQRTEAPSQLRKSQQFAEFQKQQEESKPKVSQMMVFSKPTFKVEYPKDQEITASVLGFQNRAQMDAANQAAKEQTQSQEKERIQKAADELYNTTAGKIYFNVIQPMANSASRTIGNVGATALRMADQDQLADQLVESFTPEKRYQGTIAGTKPTKLQGNLFNNGKMDISKLPSNIVKGLTDMAWLLAPAGSLTKVGTAAGLSQGAAQGTALFGSSYLNSREGYYQDGKSAGLKGDQLDYFASGAAALTSSLEALFPNDIALGGFRTKMAKEYAKQIAKGVTAKVALKAGVKDVLIEAGIKEPTQELLQLAGDKVARTISDMTSGQNNFGDQFDWNKSKDEIYETVVLTPIISAIASGSGAMRNYSPSNYEKALFFDASNNSSKVFESLNKQLANGQITQDQFNTAKERFTKYNAAADQVKKLGYSDDQTVQMAWELFLGKENLPTTQAVSADPILKDALGKDLKKDKETTAENIRLIGMGVPSVGSEIDGKEVSFVISNIGDKGSEVSQQLVDDIGDDTYRVEDVSVKELYNNNPEFKSYVDGYKSGSIGSDALMVPAVIKNGSIIDGRARLAEQYLSGKNNVKVFKNISDAIDESTVQEGRTEGNISQPQGAVQGQPEVGKGKGIQGQATQPQANVSDSNIGSQGQVAIPFEITTYIQGKHKEDYDAAVDRLVKQGKTVEDANTIVTDAVSKALQLELPSMMKEVGIQSDMISVTPSEGGYTNTESGKYDFSPNIMITMDDNSSVEDVDAVMKAANTAADQQSANAFMNATEEEVDADGPDIHGVFIFDRPQQMSKQDFSNMMFELHGIKDSNGNDFLTGHSDFGKNLIGIGGHFYGKQFFAEVEKNLDKINTILSKYGVNLSSTDLIKKKVLTYERGAKLQDNTGTLQGETEDIGRVQTKSERLIEKAKDLYSRAIQSVGANATIEQELRQELSGIDEALATSIESATASLKKAGIKLQVVDSSKGEGQARGQQAIFVSEDGTVFIDKAKLGSDIEAGLVVWHEASHPVMNIIRNTNKPLYDAVVRGLKKAAKTNDGVFDALDWAKSQKQYDNADTQNDEAIVETIGRINAGLIDVNSLETGLRQKLIDFVNSIAKFFGIDPILNDTDIAAFKKTVSEVSDALKTGRDLADVVGEENIKATDNQLVQLRAKSEDIARITEDKTIEGKPQPSMILIGKKKGQDIELYSGPASIQELKKIKPEMYISRAEEFAKSDLVQGKVRSYNSNANLDSKIKWADNIFNIAKETVVSNLLYIYDSIPKEIRDISKLWYDGANIIAQELSKKYNTTLEQASAVIASQSPQKPWYDNVHLAHFIMDFYANKKDMEFSREMYDYYVLKSQPTKQNPTGYPKQIQYLPILEKSIGKKFDQLSKYDKSVMIRADFDNNYERRAPLRIPTGAIVGRVNSMSSFSGYDTIAKAVSILEDGSEKNISENLGKAYKVRNFNNNISNPKMNGEVTIDTHAMAAAYMLPLGSSSPEVKFDEATYAFFADAYRDAASKRGVLAREMQSIVWEGVRSIFPASDKSEANKSKARVIWSQYKNGLLTLQDVQKQIKENGKDLSITDWSRFTDRILEENGQSSYLEELPLASRDKLASGSRDSSSDIRKLSGVGEGGEQIGRTQSSVGNRPEQSRDFRVAAFVMRKLGEGADKNEIAQGVSSATGMSVDDVNKIIADPEQYIRNSFPELSKIAQDNLIERAKIQNIYRGRQFGMPINKAFVGTEVPRSSVVEYLNKTNKIDKSFKDSVKDFKNKWLDPAKGLPDWVLAIRDFSVGRKNIEVARAIKTIENLKDEAKNIGFTDWDAFSKAMVAVRDVQRYIPDESGLTLFDPYRAAEGRMFTTPDDMLPAVIPDELKAIPESLRPFAVQMRQQIDGLTKDLIGSGYVTPEQAVTLEKNLGQYVNRAYKMYNERGFKPNPDQVVDAIKFIADQKIKEILTELFPEGKPSTSKEVSDFKGNVIDPENINMEDLYNQAVEEAKKDVQAILDKKKNPYFNTKTDSRDAGILKERKDIPEPIRKLMGEYTDPGTVFVMTVAKQAALAAQTEYLTKLRDFGMGTIFFERYDRNRPAEFSVQIAPTGTETKSPLGGLYTAPEIAEALEMADPSYNELTNAWMKIVGAVRWGKTVGSVATQAKNFESNIGFAVLNGMFLTGENTKALKAASKYVKGQYSKAEMDQITEKAVKLNLVGQSVGARELADMLGSGDIHDIALEIAANPNNMWGRKAKKSLNVFGAANKLYRMGDDFWKVYAYINEREMVARGRYKSSYESLNAEQQEKVDIESSERVKNTWPTYDRVVEGAKYVSKRAPIFGNFISFQAESLRVLANSIKMAREDMKDPEMREAGIKRAIGIMTYVGLRAAITSAVASAAGMAASGILGAAFGDDEEEQKKRAFKKAMPIYTRTADIAVVPTDQPHKFTTFSLSSLDPYGIIPNSLNAFTEGREGIFSKEMQPGVAAAGAEFFSGFLEPEMTFSTMYSVMNNINPKTGRPIVLDSDTPSDVTKKVGSFVIGQLEPSTISLIERGMERGWKPEIASFVGARPIDIDLHKSFGYVLSDMGKQMDAIKSEYNSIKYNERSTEEEKAKAEAEAERKKAFLISKVSETYRDFIKVGANPKVLDEMITERSSIKTTGFDKTTKRAIKTGEIKPEKLFK